MPYFLKEVWCKLVPLQVNSPRVELVSQSVTAVTNVLKTRDWDYIAFCNKL